MILSALTGTRTTEPNQMNAHKKTLNFDCSKLEFSRQDQCSVHIGYETCQVEASTTCLI
jgi:hypothetical protein